MKRQGGISQLSEAIDNLDTSDKSLCRVCILLCEITYMDKDEADEVLSEVPSLDEYIVVPLKRSQAVCVRFKEKVIVAFEGSATLRHFLSNLDIRGVSTEMGIFPAGFSRAAWDFLDDRAAIKVGTWAEKNDVTYCGHSRGGAVAGIVAAGMRAWGLQCSHVITFGAPKFADATHIKWVKTNMPETKYLQYANEGDPITSLPPSSWREFFSLTFKIFVEPFFMLYKKVFRKKSS